MSDFSNDDLIELEWFFNDASGAIGLRSPGFEGSGDTVCPTSASAERKMIRAMGAAGRIKRVDEILSSMTAGQRQHLRDSLTYDLKRFAIPRELTLHHPKQYCFGAHASAAMREFLLELGVEWNGLDGLSWLVRAESAKADGAVPAERLTRLKCEAWAQSESTTRDALDAFATARGKYDDLPANRARRGRFPGNEAE